MQLAHSKALLRASLLVLTLAFVTADETIHRWKDSEDIIIWANKIGPSYNPQESYEYYTLPFCKGSKPLSERFHTLGEAIEGNRLFDTGHVLKFKEDSSNVLLCSLTLSAEDKKAFQYAVSSNYWTEFYVDDLPALDMIGEIHTEKTQEYEPGKIYDDVYLYTHKQFEIGYNGDRIVSLSYTPTDPVKIETNAELSFTYGIVWTQSDIEFEKRMEEYWEDEFYKKPVHWYSILNSFGMVLLLIGAVAFILAKALKKDFEELKKDQEALEEGEFGFIEGTGWKQLSKEVFFPPSYLKLFTGLISSGLTLYVVFAVLILSLMTDLIYVQRGTITNVGIILYCLSGFPGGYLGGAFYSRHHGKKWINCMILCLFFWPSVVTVVLSVLNTIAIFYGASAAIPFGSIVVVVLIFLLLATPIHLGGTLLGRNKKSAGDKHKELTLRSPYVKEKTSWFTKSGFLILISGIFPFASISTELYFILMSFWSFNYYYLYGFLFLSIFILTLTLICVSIVATYILLNSEDHRWQWLSFLSSASTGFYAFLCSLVFYMQSDMAGLFQTAFFFGYSFLFCFSLALMCGTIGFAGAYVFVKTIYVKQD